MGRHYLWLLGGATNNMTEQQLLYLYRNQTGTFYNSIPTSVGLPGNGAIAWKSGFPDALFNPFFFWVQTSINIDLETRVFGVNIKFNLFQVQIGEFAPQIGLNIISDACDFLPTVEQNGVSVEYYPETYEYHAAYSLLGNVATLAEVPAIPDYIDPPEMTYAWSEESVVLFQGNYDLVAG